MSLQIQFINPPLINYDSKWLGSIFFFITCAGKQTIILLLLPFMTDDETEKPLKWFRVQKSNKMALKSAHY